MYVTSKLSDTERSLAVEEILEDIPGGCVIEKDDLPTSSSGIKEGTLVGKDSNGIYHIIKTARLKNAVTTGATHVVVQEDHEFKVGDFLGTSASGFASGALISAISASGAGYNVITATWAGANVAASGILVAASGLGHSNFLYTVEGITTNYVEKDKENTGAGVMVRGRVRQNLMPYHIDDTLKTKLPLVRFV